MRIQLQERERNEIIEQARADVARGLHPTCVQGMALLDEIDRLQALLDAETSQKEAADE